MMKDERPPAGGDARGHNIALDTLQVYCGGPGADSCPHAAP